MDDAGIDQRYRLAAAVATASLIDGDDLASFGEVFEPPKQYRWENGIDHLFSCAKEQELITISLSNARKEDPATLYDDLLVAPAMGAYTAVSGWTAEGEMATAMERIMGGVDAV